MKKTAVLIYDQFCNFEISVALEILNLAQKPITIFAKERGLVISEEGLSVLADQGIAEINLSEYDSLLLPGAHDIRKAIEDDSILSFIKLFDDTEKIIGAISIAPVLLLKSGMLCSKPFMAGINKTDLLEEGFLEQELSNMQGWDDNLKKPIEDGFLIAGNIITSVAYEFVRFALAFAKLLGIDIPAWTFGIRE